jgi:MoxR-like ATPase
MSLSFKRIQFTPDLMPSDITGTELLQEDEPQQHADHRPGTGAPEWRDRVGVRTLFIAPGNPWEKGFIESFHGKLRDELLDVELFDTLL